MIGPAAFCFTALLAATSAQSLSASIDAATGAGSNMIGGMRQAANSLGTAKGSAVQAGADTFKAGVKLGAGMASMIPGVGSFAGLGANLLNSKADTVNSLAQGKIKTMLALENTKLDVMDKGISLAGNAAKLGSNIAGTGASLLSSLPGVSSSLSATVPGASSQPNIPSTLSSSIPGGSSLTSALTGNGGSVPGSNLVSTFTNLASSAMGSNNNVATVTTTTTTTPRPNTLLSLFSSFAG